MRGNIPGWSEPRPVCVADGDSLSGLSVRKGDDMAAAGSVAWVAEAGTPRLNQNWIMTGPCASLIAGFEMNSVALQTGEVYQIEDASRIRRLNGASLPSDVFAPAAAALHVGHFLGATRVNYSSHDETSGDFLGLWRDQDTWVVASFAWKGGAAVGSAKPLMRSKLPIRGINYFPAVDTPAGTITFVQSLDVRKVALIGFDWSHPNWFRTP